MVTSFLRGYEMSCISYLGKMGSILWAFANGYDTSPVRKENTEQQIR